jgi:O-antigen/teichoic acid export membrane protein
LNWKEEVLPLQWRMAVQGAVAWGANQMPVLVILHFYPSSGEAGRLGMTWTILSAFQSACMALVETRRPLFGSLIARGEHADLDKLFARYSKLSVQFMAVAVTLFTVFVWLTGTRTEWLPLRISQHLLPAVPTALLSIAFVAYQFVMCIGIYVRAHRVDPFLVASVVSCLFLSTTEYLLGSTYGAVGVSVAYLTGVTLVLTPFYISIYRGFRRKKRFPRAS